MSPNALDQSKTFKVCCQNMSSAFSAVKCDVTTHVTEESVHCRLSNVQYYKRAVNTSWWVHDNTLLTICQNLWSTSRRERHPSVCKQHMFVSSMLTKRQFPCILVQVAYLSFYRVQYIYKSSEKANTVKLRGHVVNTAQIMSMWIVLISDMIILTSSSMSVAKAFIPV